MTNEKKVQKSAAFYKNLIWLMFISGWLTFAGVFVHTVMVMNKDAGEFVNRDLFLTNADIHVEESSVGANIWLKQTVHGLNGIKYRYVVETDCPSWDFESRYVSDKPLDWVEDTSAVEVIVYDTQIRYHGTVCASGQYYTVPILGNLSSESTSREEWETNLAERAYQSYVAGVKKEEQTKWLPLGIFAFAMQMILVRILRSYKNRKTSIEKTPLDAAMDDDWKEYKEKDREV